MHYSSWKSEVLFQFENQFAENPVPAILQGTRGWRSNICRISKTMAGSLNKLSSQSFATNERVLQINNVY